MHEAIHINQLGYRPEDRKLLFVAGGGGSFEIVDEAEVVVLCGDFVGPHDDDASGDEVYVGDFSELRSPGTFTIHVPGVGSSLPFRIAEQVYGEVHQALLSCRTCPSGGAIPKSDASIYTGALAIDSQGTE